MIQDLCNDAVEGFSKDLLKIIAYMRHHGVSDRDILDAVEAELRANIPPDQRRRVGP